MASHYAPNYELRFQIAKHGELLTKYYLIGTGEESEHRSKLRHFNNVQLCRCR